MQRLGLLILAAGFLAACAAPGPVPGDTFYRLPPIANAGAPVRLTDDVLYVAELHVEGIQRERAILYSLEPEAVVLDQYHYHFWSTTPGRLVRDHLAEYLTGVQAADQVIIDPVATPGLTVRGRIEQLLHIRESDSPSVLVTLQLRLERPDQSRPLLINNYREQVPVTDGESMEAVVHAMSEALQRIYAQFLRDSHQAVSG